MTTKLIYFPLLKTFTFEKGGMYKFPTLQSSPMATLFSSAISQLMYLSSWNNITNIKAHQRQDSSEVHQKYKELKAGCQISETKSNKIKWPPALWWNAGCWETSGKVWVEKHHLQCWPMWCLTWCFFHYPGQSMACSCRTCWENSSLKHKLSIFIHFINESF